MNKWFKKQLRTDADAKLDEVEPDRDEPLPIDKDSEAVAPPTCRRTDGIQGGNRPVKGGYWFIRERYRQEVEETVAKDKARMKNSIGSSTESLEDEEEEMRTEKQYFGEYAGQEDYGPPPFSSFLLSSAIAPPPPAFLPPLSSELPAPPFAATHGFPAPWRRFTPPPAFLSTFGTPPGSHQQLPLPSPYLRNEWQDGTRQDKACFLQPPSFPRPPADRGPPYSRRR